MTTRLTLTTRHTVVSALVGILLAIPLVAAAQRGPRGDVANIKEVERLKKEGRRLFRVNKLVEAKEKFESALALTTLPDDELLYNLAFITFETKECEKFLLYVTGFMYVSPGDPSIPDLKSKRKRCIERLPRKGTAVIESIRPETAEVRINDVVVGRTPVYGIELPPGGYTVKSEQPDYHPYESTLVVQEGVEVRHRIKMRKRIFKGHLEVVTVPEGATVYLDNARVGKAPWTRKELDTQRYLVRIEMDGWDRWVRYVTVRKDATEHVEARLEKTGMHVPIPPLPSQDD